MIGGNPLGGYSREDIRIGFDILDYSQRLSYRRCARIDTVMEELQQNLKTMCQKIETLVERL